MAQDNQEGKVFAARFLQPLQFIGVKGVDETRVFHGLVEDVPEVLANDDAFNTYKNSKLIEVTGEIKVSDSGSGQQGDPDLEGNVGEVLARAKDLSKDQLAELKAKEEAAQNRKGVVEGIDKLIAEKG